jgi:sugar lactone lactonase YvrE
MSPDSTSDSRTAFDRRTLLKTLSAAGLVGLGSTPVSARGASDRFPDLIPLPTGFQPEGIVSGRGTDFFVGSLATGDVFRGDYRTGEGEVLSTEGSTAVGLSYDRRSDRLFVAGDGTGQAFVYDAETGDTEATYQLTDPGTFVNDVVVTREAAYFTDSFRVSDDGRPFFYRVPLGPGGRLPDQRDVTEVEIGEEFAVVQGFNSNGIDAPPNGEYLIVVNSSTGLLYRVDPTTGEATEIDLGGDLVTAGDGILLDGKTLYVVRNQLNRIAVVELAPDASSGEVVGAITDPDFDVPTTVAEFGNSLYAVNARFGVENPGAAEYDVVGVSKE